MKSLTHEQVQQMLHSGLPQSEALSSHLAACSQCRSYAALVTELSTTLPAIYSPAVFSPQEIRQKAADGNGQLLRRTRSALTLRNLRSGVLVGGSVVVLLFLTILAPKLLPVQPVGAPDLIDIGAVERGASGWAGPLRPGTAGTHQAQCA